MKKWLRIVFFLSFLVIVFPFPLMIIQAQERGPTIKNATVEKISDQQTDQAKLSVALDLDANEKATLELADNDQANFDTTDKVKIDEQQAKAEFDNENPEQLMVENVTSKAQTITLEVPLAINYQTTAATLQLQLLLNHDQEKYDVPEFKLSNDAPASNITEPNAESVFDNQQPVSQTAESTTSAQQPAAESSQPVTKEEPTKTNEKVESKSSQKQVTARQVKKQASSNTAKAESTTTDEAEDGEGDGQKTVRAEPEEGVKIDRGNVQQSAWSDTLDVKVSYPTTEGSEPTEENRHSEFFAKTDIAKSDYWHTGNYKDGYYQSYDKPEDDPKNDSKKAKAYAVKFNEETTEATISVNYTNVGVYYETANSTVAKQMGAQITITNVKFLDRKNQQRPNSPSDEQDRYIDFSNNFYSGLFYNGIAEFDIDIVFTDNATGKLLNFNPSDNENNKSYFTFSSLNGQYDSTAKEWVSCEWAGSRTGATGMLSDHSQVVSKGDGWYAGIGDGVWDGGEYTTGNKWGDFLGSTNYENGAVSFALSGITHKFKLKSEHGYTWQSFSSGSVRPLENEQPFKTVTRNPGYEITPSGKNNLDGATIDRDEDNLSSFYYTIYQKTYNIPDKSIAKPNKIVITDTLDSGLSVTDKNQITLYNTDGKTIPYNSTNQKKGTVEIVGQTITYTLSNWEIQELKFDGNSFGLQIPVSVTFDESISQQTFRNTGFVKFDNHTDKETNEVVTEFVKGPTTDTLELFKQGDMPFEPDQMNPISNVKFELKVKDREEKSTVYTTDPNGKLQLEGLDRSQTYLLTENKVTGYEEQATATLAYSKTERKWIITGNKNFVLTDTNNGQLITVTNQASRGNYLFQKIDSISKTGLNGAKFVVKHDNKYLTFDANGKMTGTATSQTADTILESKSNGTKEGIINISGLPYGNYQLIEVAAPDGYAIASKGISFTVNANSGGDAQPVENTRYSLPVTGGSGIIWIIIIGLISISLSLAIRRTHSRGG